MNFKAELIAFGCDFLDDMPGNKDIPHVAGNFNKEVGNIFAIFDYINGSPGFGMIVENQPTQLVGYVPFPYDIAKRIAMNFKGA